MQLVINGKPYGSHLERGALFALADCLCLDHGYRRLVVTNTAICLAKG